MTTEDLNESLKEVLSHLKSADSKALALMRARDGEPKRKIVQLARLGDDRTACVDNEGRAWELHHNLDGMVWVPLPDLPQGDL